MLLLVHFGKSQPLVNEPMSGTDKLITVGAALFVLLVFSYLCYWHRGTE